MYILNIKKINRGKKQIRGSLVIMQLNSIINSKNNVAKIIIYKLKCTLRAKATN